jgi:glucokinase
MRVLAGDIGGTKTLLGIVEVLPPGAPDAPPTVTVLHTARFKSRDYPGLAEVLLEFGAGLPEGARERLGTSLPRRAAFGVAGPVHDDRCEATNFPWMMDGRALERGLGLARVRLFNDFVALAHGVPAIPPSRLFVLQEAPRNPSGPFALIGAGTGLGEAIGVSLSGAHRAVLATEGGHSTFAPRTEEERAIARELAQRLGHVSWERVVCGDGLVNLAVALAAVRGVPLPPRLAQLVERARQDAPALVTELAREGEPICRRALELFCELYGAEAGNLALKCLPTGGVFIAGGIAPQILHELRDGRFLAAFLDKGRMRPLLARFPVHVVQDEDAPLRGAALLAAED